MAKITKWTQVLDIMRELSPTYEPKWEDVRWFLAWQMAEEYSDMGTKDIARLLDGGSISGIVDAEHADDYLDMCDYTKTSIKKCLRAWGYNKQYTDEKTEHEKLFKIRKGMLGKDEIYI